MQHRPCLVCTMDSDLHYSILLTLGCNVMRAQVGYQITLVKFFLFFGLTFLLLLISETLGILCAGLHRNELVGMIILATFYVPLLMFTGFIQVRIQSPVISAHPLRSCCISSWHLNHVGPTWVLPAMRFSLHMHANARRSLAYPSRSAGRAMLLLLASAYA